MSEKNFKYYQLTVSCEGYSSREFYIAAENAEVAQNIVKNFRAYQNTIGSKISQVKELSLQDYLYFRNGVEKRKSELKSFDVVVSIPNEKSTSAEIKHIYIRSDNKETAKIHTENILMKKEKTAGGKVLEIHEITYEQFKEKRESNGLKFFKVEARCGHVGDGMFYPVNFYVTGKNKEEAVEKVKAFPRVKKSNAKSAIISIREIDRDGYEKGQIEMQNNPFLHHNTLNKEQQKQLDELIEQKKQVLDEVSRMLSKKNKMVKDFTEEQLQIKNYKQKKKRYTQDAGLHLDKSLKYGKKIIFED